MEKLFQIFNLNVLDNSPNADLPAIVNSSNIFVDSPTTPKLTKEEINYNNIIK